MSKNPFDLGIKPIKIAPFKIPKFDLSDYNKTGKKVRTPITHSVQKDIFIRAKGNCERCKKSLTGLTPHIHHKNQNPSDNKKSNLLLVCPDCHSRLHKTNKVGKGKPKEPKNPYALDIPKFKVPRLF